MLICSVVGARPNFMKVAPVVLELQRKGVPQFLIHTGQHYDPEMSEVFFADLGMQKADATLAVGSDTHGRQTARIMLALEEVWEEKRPDLVLVGGDVNSTLAVALVASKQRIPIAHVEAGLRSFDRTMPEEVNRVVTDHLSNLLFTTEESGNQNLFREGIPEGRVHFVGNCMVDTLKKHVTAAVQRGPWTTWGLKAGGYALLTVHRPCNVDDPRVLKLLLGTIQGISRHLPIIFPVHPRTREQMDREKIGMKGSAYLTGPLSYLNFLGLMAKARLVLTDSGGVQEETTALGIPCLTLRENTERPVTLTSGTNRLVGTDPEKIRRGFEDVLAGNWPPAKEPILWDGQAGRRVAETIEVWAGARFKSRALPVLKREGKRKRLGPQRENFRSGGEGER